MKILLVSDSHGDERILKELVTAYPNMDYYLHAGDSGLDRDTLYPFESVRGNTDYYPFDDLLRIYTPMGYLLIKHKPGFTIEQTPIPKPCGPSSDWRCKCRRFISASASATPLQRNK